jgi:hypothetical protein
MDHNASSEQQQQSTNNNNTKSSDDVKESNQHDEESESDDLGIQRISMRDMSVTNIVPIWKDIRHNYYISLDWRPAFYISLAYHGFISVAQEGYLIPEIQKTYCMLDFDQLHIGKNERKRAAKYRITIDSHLEEVLDGITAKHSNCWVVANYKTLFRELFQHPVSIPVSEDSRTQFQAHSVALLDETGRVIAGEIGYTIGSTYTSLTGYFNTEKIDESSQQHTLKYNSAGKVQLLALGRLLHRAGYSFWNLGHPPRRATPTKPASMWYKAEIGGHVVDRAAFLERWIRARDDTPRPLLCENGVQPASSLLTKTVPQQK